MTSPVTHVAEVEVNRQSKNGVYLPSFEEIGRHSNTAPIRIMTRKPVTSVLAGESRFVFLFSIGIIRSLCRDGICYALRYVVLGHIFGFFYCYALKHYVITRLIGELKAHP